MGCRQVLCGCDLEDETMTERTCENCRWWEYDQHAIGACMRKPPQRIAEPQYDEWPKTHATDRCGEWSDASITPEQDERRQFVRQIFLAMTASEWGASYSEEDMWKLAGKLAAAEPQIQREDGK